VSVATTASAAIAGGRRRSDEREGLIFYVLIVRDARSSSGLG
jgi:hypothetical protein